MRGTACVLLLLLAAAARASDPLEPVEPPPESPTGSDYVTESADSLEEGSVEVGVGANGRPGGALRRTRRLRFRGDGLNASVHDGAGDPLAGGVVEGGLAGGTVRAGRLAPRWGRGLLLGAPAEPWEAAAEDRGTGRGGRAGQGLMFRRGGAVQAMAGRFERRGIGGLGLFGGGWGAGALTDGHRRHQTSLSFARSDADAELAMDRRGRWRAEVFGTGRVAHATAFAHVRGGSAAFGSIAEPKRSGPAQAVTLRLVGPDARIAWQALASTWRFLPGVTGGRAALLLSTATAGGGAALGLEEQHGPRRLPSSGAAPRGMRQGAWAEWRGSRPGFTLRLRQEIWGGQRLRRAVRRVSGAHVEIAGPGAARVRFAHTVFRTRFGESLYLREAYSDRLVLRALTGFGDRTRVELRVPVARGRLAASLLLTRTRAGPARLQWTLDWSRHARTRSPNS